MEGGAWQTLDLGVSVDLVAANSHFERLTAAGAGVLVDIDAHGDPTNRLVCDLGGIAIAHLVWSLDFTTDDGDYFVVVTAGGSILRGIVGLGEGELCDTAYQVPGALTAKFLGGEYLFVLTEDEVYRQAVGSASPVD